MKKIILCWIIVFLIAGISASSVFAQEKEIRELSLEEFIKTVPEKDYKFEEILIDRLALRYKKALGLPAGDFVLSVKNENAFLFDPKERDSENTLSLSKLFPRTGTDISSEYSSSISTSTRAVTSEVTTTISQPIAENAFGRNTRLLDKIIGLEIDVAEFQITEAYEDYFASLILLYYDWYSAHEDLKTAQNSYNENLKLLGNIKERQKRSIALDIDVNKISLQVLVKKESLITLRTKYNDYLNMIKDALGYESDDEIQPSAPDLYEELNIDFSEDYNQFRHNSRTSRVLELLTDKSILEVDRYADELLPSIDLFATYFVKGSFHDIYKSDRFFYAGVTLDWPLPGDVERAQYETAKVERDRTKLSSGNTHDTLYVDLKNLNNQIQREKELILIAEEKIALARAIVDEDTENYSLGRVTLNDFIDEVNKLETNKFNKVFHEIQLKRLIIEWLRLTDQLIAKNKIPYKKQD